MGLFDRIRSRIRGSMDRAVEGLEQQNPEAVYQAAIEAARASIAEHRSRAASLVGQRDRLVERVEALEREAAATTAALHEAVDEGDDDTALVLQVRSSELAEEVEVRRAERDLASEAAATAQAAVAEIKDGVRKLEAERDRQLASLAVSKASLDIQEANSGLGADPGARALDSVREAIDRLDSAADPTGAGARPRLAAKATAELSARAQLEQLKRQRGLPASDDDEDD
jgi:phage shock protein A